jgi:hypothetical protein
MRKCAVEDDNCVDCWMASCKLTEMAAAKESGQSLGIPQMAIAPYTYHQIAQDTSMIFYSLESENLLFDTIQCR